MPKKLGRPAFYVKPLRHSFMLSAGALASVRRLVKLPYRSMSDVVEAAIRDFARRRKRSNTG